MRNMAWIQRKGQSQTCYLVEWYLYKSYAIYLQHPFQQSVKSLVSTVSIFYNIFNIQECQYIVIKLPKIIELEKQGVLLDRSFSLTIKIEIYRSVNVFCIRLWNDAYSHVFFTDNSRNAFVQDFLHCELFKDRGS